MCIFILAKLHIQLNILYKYTYCISRKTDYPRNIGGKKKATKPAASQPTSEPTNQPSKRTNHHQQHDSRNVYRRDKTYPYTRLINTHIRIYFWTFIIDKTVLVLSVLLWVQHKYYFVQEVPNWFFVVVRNIRKQYQQQ